MDYLTGTLINSVGTDPIALRAAGNSTGGAENRFFASETTGHSASCAAGKYVGGIRSNRADGVTADMAGNEDPAPQESERHGRKGTTQCF